MFIIGSHALRAQISTAFRKPADLDVICTLAEMEDFCSKNELFPIHLHGSHYIVHDAPVYKHIEFLVSDFSPAATAYTAYMDEYEAAHRAGADAGITTVYGQTMFFAPLELLFSLKKSHRFLPRQWEKNIRDYHLLKSLVGEDKMPALTKMKSDETKKIKTPSLDKTKADFFDDHVSNHTFEHDQIHEIMAHREKPMFEYIKVDADKVTCSKEKFFALEYTDRMKCVLEEAYVIALERGIIPMLYEGKKLATSDSALQWSLMRICTTLCSGWFREFAVEHYPSIWNYRDRSYVQKFLKAVDDGRIKRIDNPNLRVGGPTGRIKPRGIGGQ